MSTQTDDKTDRDNSEQLDDAVNAVVMPLADALNAIAHSLDRIARELSASSYRSA